MTDAKKVATDYFLALHVKQIRFIFKHFWLVCED